MLDFFDEGDGTTQTYGGTVERNRTAEEFADEVIALLRHEVEIGRSWRLFDPDEGAAAIDESQLQLVFEMICAVHNRENDFSIDPQPNHGAGVLDVAISRGEADCCCVELKLSTHSNLPHGLTTQLPAYMRARRCVNGRLVVLCPERGRSPDQVADVLAAVEPPADLSIDVAILDARRRPGASKLPAE